MNACFKCMGENFMKFCACSTNHLKKYLLKIYNLKLLHLSVTGREGNLIDCLKLSCNQMHNLTVVLLICSLSSRLEDSVI